MTETSDAITAKVKAFYEELPFNYYASTQETCDQLQQNIIANTYPDLDQLLSSGKINSVLEFGCGARWLTRCDH